MATATCEINMKTINLGAYRENGVHVISGRPKGRYARSLEFLDTIDSDPTVSVLLTIPEDVLIVNPSFFLGLIGNSVEKLGATIFKERYQLETANELISHRWMEAIDRASTEAHLRS